MRKKKKKKKRTISTEWEDKAQGLWRTLEQEEE